MSPIIPALPHQIVSVDTMRDCVVVLFADGREYLISAEMLYMLGDLDLPTEINKLE